MVSVLNGVFKWMRVLNPVAHVVGAFTLAFMSKKEQDALGLTHAIDSFQNMVNSLFERAKKNTPEKGFTIHEVMSGEHEFTSGHGPKGKHAFFFEGDWGPKNLVDFLNASDNSKFMVSHLKGTVTVGGLCQNMPMEGKLELRYLQEQKIRYTFSFEVSGERYTYVGEKRDIYPWNLLYSHTTCFGTLTKESSGEVISNSVTHFDMGSMPQFLGSLALTG